MVNGRMGNEKPYAETRVRVLQQQWATPVPRCADREALNAYLRCRCRRTRSTRGRTGQAQPRTHYPGPPSSLPPGLDVTTGRQRCFGPLPACCCSLLEDLDHAAGADRAAALADSEAQPLVPGDGRVLVSRN
jgi:hypothetical protein